MKIPTQSLIQLTRFSGKNFLDDANSSQETEPTKTILEEDQYSPTVKNPFDRRLQKIKSNHNKALKNLEHYFSSPLRMKLLEFTCNKLNEIAQYDKDKQAYKEYKKQTQFWKRKNDPYNLKKPKRGSSFGMFKELKQIDPSLTKKEFNGMINELGKNGIKALDNFEEFTLFLNELLIYLKAKQD